MCIWFTTVDFVPLNEVQPFPQAPAQTTWFLPTEKQHLKWVLPAGHISLQGNWLTMGTFTSQPNSKTLSVSSLKWGRGQLATEPFCLVLGISYSQLGHKAMKGQLSLLFCHSFILSQKPQSSYWPELSHILLPQPMRRVEQWWLSSAVPVNRKEWHQLSSICRYKHEHLCGYQPLWMLWYGMEFWSACWMSQLVRSPDFRKTMQSTVRNHMAMHNQILIWTKQALVRKENAGRARL